MLSAISRTRKISFNLSSHAPKSIISSRKASNLTLQSEFTNATLSEQTTGNFYIQRIRNVSYYQSVLEFFMNQAAVYENLDMLRIMAADGNVLVGVVNNQEDLLDYKGDKQWLQETLTQSENYSVYISPISIARLNIFCCSGSSSITRASGFSSWFMLFFLIYTQG